MVPTLVLVLAAAPPSPAQVRQAVARMQAFYEKAHDLRVAFDQTFVDAAFHRTLKSSGTLDFEKPGKIRFDYVKPEPKLFVVKGGRIVTYVPAAQQAMVGAFDADRLSASVTFLWGRGRLEDEFTITAAKRPGLAPGLALALTPRRPDPRFARLWFVVDPKTYAVKESVVLDGAGNENRFDFHDVRVNAGLPAGTFDFAPPAGTEIVPMSGQPDRGAR